jgi:hypothetical protein
MLALLVPGGASAQDAPPAADAAPVAEAAPVADAAPAAEAGAGAELGVDVQAAVTTEAAVEPKAKKVPYRGTNVAYRNAMSALTLNKSADYTYNPFYVMALDLQPKWWFGDIFNMGLALNISGELTEADDTTYANEAVIDDLKIKLGASKFYTIPVLKIDLGAKLDFVTPTSKLSQARTLILGLKPGLSVGRTFELLKGLNINYAFGVTRNFYRSATPQLEEPRIAGATGEQFLALSGKRNALWGLSHMLVLGLGITDWLSFSTNVGVSISYAAPMGDQCIEIEGVPGCIEPSDSPNATEQRKRYMMLYGAEFEAKPWGPLGIALGFETANPQLNTQSEYEAPFVNRYTALFLDLRLDVASLVSELKGSEE